MTHSSQNPTRRKVLRAAAAAAIAMPAIKVTNYAWAGGQKKITFAWNQNAYCLTPIVVAHELGYFEKNGLDVDLLNYSGSTDQLLESIATRKADAAVGMIHRWIKSLESGLDVKIIGSSHGGCVRLVGYQPSGVKTLDDLRGKTVGVSDLAAPGKHFFTILLAKYGIDVDKDITWRQYPADLLGVAAEKGEIQAIADGDPNLYLLQKRTGDAFVELATNLTGEYARKVCCVFGANGDLVRKERPTAAAISRALVQATQFVHENPKEGARVFAKYAPKITEEDILKLYEQLTFNHHPTGQDLRDELAFYAADFRKIGVLKQSTDPEKLADHVYVNVLG